MTKNTSKGAEKVADRDRHVPRHPQTGNGPKGIGNNRDELDPSELRDLGIKVGEPIPDSQAQKRLNP